MDLHPLKEKARAFLSKGKLARSLQAYEELISRDAQDPLLRLRHAEACRKAGRVDQAAESYRTAATLFASGGHPVRARAALRMALALKPKDSAILLALSEVDQRATSPSLQVVPARSRVAKPLLTGPQMRRLSPTAVAVRAEGGQWFVVSSEAPVDVNLLTDTALFEGTLGEDPNDLTNRV